MAKIHRWSCCATSKGYAGWSYPKGKGAATAISKTNGNSCKGRSFDERHAALVQHTIRCLQVLMLSGVATDRSSERRLGLALRDALGTKFWDSWEHLRCPVSVRMEHRRTERMTGLHASPACQELASQALSTASANFPLPPRQQS